MHVLPFILAALCVLALAYRYYSAFLAARVLALDDSRETPTYLPSKAVLGAGAWAAAGNATARAATDRSALPLQDMFSSLILPEQY